MWTILLKTMDRGSLLKCRCSTPGLMNKNFSVKLRTYKISTIFLEIILQNTFEKQHKGIGFDVSKINWNDLRCLN